MAFVFLFLHVVLMKNSPKLKSMRSEPVFKQIFLNFLHVFGGGSS